MLETHVVEDFESSGCVKSQRTSFPVFMTVEVDAYLGLCKLFH